MEIDNIVPRYDNTEILQAEMNFTSDRQLTEVDLQEELRRVNEELEKYTNHLDRGEYALAVGIGIIAGAIDSLYVGKVTVTKGDVALSHKQVNHFIEAYAKTKDLKKDSLQATIAALEQHHKVAQDNVWKGADIKVSATNHHLADLAHHPTPVGLVAAIAVQFLRIGVFVNREGEWHFKFVETTKEDILQIVIPAIITGILNWLVQVKIEDFEEQEELQIPDSLKKLLHVTASAPILIEVAKCADNWFGHLVSDMGGCKNTAGNGMGIPGIFVSLLHEIAALPILKDTELPRIVDNLYQKQKIDLRHELAYLNAAKKQAVPVIFTELMTRVVYFAAELAKQSREIAANGGSIRDVQWEKVIPFGNRSIDRMLTVAHMTFTAADTADATVRSALESSGNIVIFAGKFATRFNYVGAGRTTLSIVKECADERKEIQLLQQKRVLMENMTDQMIAVLEDYQTQLEVQVANYLAEDISSFMEGFKSIQDGLKVSNSNLVIKGSVVIQKVLGREPQFTNQAEFDALMEGDEALVF